LHSAIQTSDLKLFIFYPDLQACIHVYNVWFDKKRFEMNSN